MHQHFLIAADYNLLPPSGTLEGADLRVKTNRRGVTFPSPIGLSSGLLIDGRGIDSIIEASGTDSASGLSTFIELGSCSPERQLPRKGLSLFSIKINMESGTVARMNTQVTPSVSQIVGNLLNRQQRIIDGKLPQVDKDNLIGVNVKAMLDTVESVPYLTHLDFARCVRELTEFVDYTVLNLAEETSTSGII